MGFCTVTGIYKRVDYLERNNKGVRMRREQTDQVFNQEVDC